VNRLSGTFALIALAAASVVAAQTSAQPQAPSATPSTQEPSSTAPVPSTSQPTPSADTNSKSAQKAMVKNCVAQQRSNNPQMSKSDAQKVCEDRMSSNSSSQR